MGSVLVDAAATAPLLANDAPPVSTTGEAARMVWQETKRLWGIGTPIAISTLSMYAVSSVTTMFVGHLGNLPLAAASIGLSVFSTFSLGFLLGMGSALETLCGQAFGAGQVAMLGVYLQRSWIILIAAALLMVPFYVFAEPLLLLIGQDPTVAREAGKFALYILPGAFAFAVNFPTGKFLQAQSKVVVLAWIGVAGLLFHVLITYLLVSVLGWGLPAAAAAYDLSLWVVALGQAAYIVGWCKDGWRGWSMAAFNEIWAFLKLSLESAIMLCLEIWYLGMITVLTGDLQDAQIAVDSLGICMNINGWEAMIFIGLNAAISVRVSNELGSGRPRAAMHAVIVVIAESLLIGLLCMALVLIFRDHFSVIYTSDVKLQHAVSKIAGLLGLTMVLNSVQPVISGDLGDATAATYSSAPPSLHLYRRRFAADRSRRATAMAVGISPEGGGLAHDLGSAAVTAGVALALLRFFEELAKRDVFEQKLNRKLVHITIGMVFLLFWPLFSLGSYAPFLAGLAPGINIIRMLLMGLGVVKNEAMVKSMSRSGDYRELLKGPLYYATTITFATSVLWRTSPIAIALICNLCAGDGIADIMGRRLGKEKLPYNPNKSYAGSIAMAAAGFLASIGYMHYFHTFGFIEESWYMALGFLVVSVAATLVESHPISTELDDNLTVPLTSFLVGSLVF